MQIETIGAEIATRSYAALAGAGLASANYPAPGHLPTLPTLIVLLDGGTVDGMNEQVLLLTFRGLLFTALEAVESQISTVDPMIVPLIDAFSPQANRANYRLLLAEPDTDGAVQVDYCRVERFEASVPIQYNGQTHYGARIFWGVKVRRNPGASS
jgi:hypothetical protein